MNWPEIARAAAIALSTGEERQDDSVTAALIRDISAVFTEHDDKPLQTSTLLEGLHRIEESPWGDWYGKPLSAHGLSRLLRSYRVRTMPVYAEGKTVRGYKVGQFSDAFAQLSVRSVRSVRSEARSQAAPNASNAPNASGAEPGAANGHPSIGDEGYLSVLVDAHEAGLITDEQRDQAWAAHTLVRKAGDEAS